MAISTAAAVIGGSVIGAGASLLGGKSAAKGAEAAAQTQASAADRASLIQAESQKENLAFQKNVFAQQQALNKPWQDAGIEALQQYSDAPEFSFNAADLENDPSYQFRQQEGIKALDRSAASRGRLLSGGQDRAITRYGSNLASTEYQNAYNRAFGEYSTSQNELLNVANIGRGAAGQTAQAAGQMGSNVGNVLSQGGAAQAQIAQSQGNALAQGQLGAAQAQASMYSNLGNVANTALGNYALYNATLPYDSQSGFIGPQRGY